MADSLAPYMPADGVAEVLRLVQVAATNLEQNSIKVENSPEQLYLKILLH